MKILIMCFAALIVLTNVRAQELDFFKLVQDTQQMVQDKDKIDFAWWMPSLLWESSFNDSPLVTIEQQKDFVDVFEKYIVFCVLEKPRESFDNRPQIPAVKNRSETSVIIGNKTLFPVDHSDLSNSTKETLKIVKQLLGEQLGPDTEFVLFKGEDEKGIKYLDPHKQGIFTFKVKERAFKWRLPLASLLSPKFDSETNEEFPGNYSYNPYTGKKLITKK